MSAFSSSQQRAGVALLADSHLTVADAEGLARMRSLLGWCRGRVQWLGLLGDVFDVWPGRAMLALPEYREVFASLRNLAESGTEILFLPGNRDFLLDRRTAAELGLSRPAGDEWVLEAEGHTLHLLHGDQLLLEDRSYQRYKWWVRSAPVRGLARVLPQAAVFALARRLRKVSIRAVSGKRPAHLEVVEEAVLERLRLGSGTLVCGHLHEARHQVWAQGELRVLPPFLERGAFLVLDESGWHSATALAETVVLDATALPETREMVAT